MVALDSNVKQVIGTEYSYGVNATCHIEWNNNQYVATDVYNDDENEAFEDYDSDLFPLDSIVQPNRPTRGIVKAWTKTNDKTGIADAISTYPNVPTPVRYYAVAPEDKYKYWVSPEPSGSAGVLTQCRPRVSYLQPVKTNKIVIGVENSDESPTDYEVQIEVGGVWTTIGPALPSIEIDDGRIVLYYQGDGNWSSLENLDNVTEITGIRFIVTEMDGYGGRLNLIEMSSRLELDMTSRLISHSSDFTQSEHSFIAPLGTVSSNTGEIVLSNVDGVLNFNHNDRNIFNSVEPTGATVTVETGTETSPGVFEYEREFTMLVEDWSAESMDGVSFQLKDNSDILQKIKPNSYLLHFGELYTEDSDVVQTSLSVGEITWRLLDSIGFNSYDYDPADSESIISIPYFWTDGESTVWEILGNIAEHTQTAIYFDRYNRLQIKPLPKHDAGQEPVWDFTAGDPANYDSSVAAGKIADIEDIQVQDTFEGNVANVQYTPVKISKENNGFPVMETVWEPDGDYVVRASPLLKTLSADNNDWLKINPGDAKHWPFSGLVQIEGEYIRYEGKQYKYYDENGTSHLKTLTSIEEQNELDAQGNLLSFKNEPTGYLKIKERGLYETTPKSHGVEASGWDYKVYRNNVKKDGTGHHWNGGWIQMPYLSRVKMHNKSWAGHDLTYVVARGGTDAAVPLQYGTRMRFTGNGKGQAGICFSLGAYDAGWYVEFRRTRDIKSRRGKEPLEISFYVRYRDGHIKRFNDRGPSKGESFEWNQNEWHDVDVYLNPKTKFVGTVTVMVDGVVRLVATVPYNQGLNYELNGKFGAFIHGQAQIQMEYFYATTNSPVPDIDNANYWDRVNGGYQSDQAIREFSYDTRTGWRIRSGRKRVKTKYHYNEVLMDEFGAIVHEVKEEEVKFDNPVIHSNLYLSNDMQVVCPEYISNAYGAKFLVASASRHDAIVNGEDTVTFGADNPVEQKAMIFGRVINQDDTKTITVKDDISVKNRGEVSIDIISDLIQTEDAAQKIADWIVAHWSKGVDSITVSSVGNPTINIGDIVTVTNILGEYETDVNSPRYGDDTPLRFDLERFFVVGISTQFSSEAGYSSTLILRREKSSD